MAIFTTARFRMVFFDRSIIRTNWSAINRNPMQRAGVLIRTIARRSIRHVTRRTTPPLPPGQPPRSRAPGRPFKMIFSVPKNAGTGVVVGMVGFDSRGVPGRQEHGGAFPVEQPMFGFRMVRSRYGGHFRARRLLGRRRVIGRFPSRPFMQPALRRASTQIPGFWRNAFTRVGGRR